MWAIQAFSDEFKAVTGTKIVGQLHKSRAGGFRDEISRHAKSGHVPNLQSDVTALLMPRVDVIASMMSLNMSFTPNRTSFATLPPKEVADRLYNIGLSSPLFSYATTTASLVVPVKCNPLSKERAPE